MKKPSIPDDIVLESVSFFRSGKRKNDPVAQYAMEVFFSRIEEGEISAEKARIYLQRKTPLYRLLKETEATIDADNAKEKELEENNRKKYKLLETTVNNTDPQTTNRAGFWTNIKAGAIYFLAGVIVSPVFSIVFKRPLDTLDKLVNGEEPRKALPITGRKEALQQRSAQNEPSTQKRSEPVPPPPESSTKQDTIPSSQATPLDLGPYGPHDPVTGKKMLTLLKDGKAVTLPNDRTTSIYMRSSSVRNKISLRAAPMP